MKAIFLLLALINFACVATHTTKQAREQLKSQKQPAQIQARLIKDSTESVGRHRLTWVSIAGDIVYGKYGTWGIGKPKFERNTWYTIQYDSADCTCGKGEIKYVRAVIRKNK